MSEESHSYRIKGKRWKEINEKAWKLSLETGKLIKPTDVVDAALFKNIKQISMLDVEAAKKTRED